MPGGDSIDRAGSSGISEDKQTATLKLLTAGRQLAQVDLSAKELEDVLRMLGEARATMRQPVSAEPPNVAGAREAVILDPRLAHQCSDPPSLDGIVLRPRHLGFEWVTFLLPPHEALGAWKMVGRKFEAKPTSEIVRAG